MTQESAGNSPAYPAGNNPAYADWRKLPPAEQARVWEKISPGTFNQIWEEAKVEGAHRRRLEEESARHERRMGWFVVVLQILRILGSFAALSALVVVAIYYINHNAPTQGASLFGVGGVALVGLFLGSDPARVDHFLKAIRQRSSDS